MIFFKNAILLFFVKSFPQFFLFIHNLSTRYILFHRYITLYILYNYATFTTFPQALLLLLTLIYILVNFFLKKLLTIIYMCVIYILRGDYMKVIDVTFSKFTSSYVLFIYFDNGARTYFDLSLAYYRCHPTWVSFSTEPGFVSRSKTVKGFSDVPFRFDPVGNLCIDLPTCCGYVSKRGNWLSTGSYHRFCVINIDDLISSLYIS